MKVQAKIYVDKTVHEKAKKVANKWKEDPNKKNLARSVSELYEIAMIAFLKTIGEWDE